MKFKYTMPLFLLPMLLAAGSVHAGSKVKRHVSIHLGSPPVYYHHPAYRHPVSPPRVMYRPVIVRHPSHVFHAGQPVIIGQAILSPAPVAVRSGGEYWFYCAQSRAHYPHVQQCPAGWMKVQP